MDQFDAFSDNTQSHQNTLQSGAGGEFDPDAAMNDFLKREQETFGTAGTDDFFGGGNVAGSNNNNNNNTLLSPENQTAASSNRNSFGGAAGSNGFDAVNMMSSAASEPAQQRKESAAALSVRAEQPTSASSFDNAALSRKESMVSNSNSISSNYQQQQQQQNRPMSATVSPTSAQTPREDTQAVKEWRAKQDKKIQARDEQMKKKHEETIQKARQEIDKFYEEYNQQKSKAIAANRESEQTFLRVRDETKVNEGINVWEKVCNQVDFNAPSSGSLMKKDTAPLSAGVGKSAQSGGRAGTSTAGGSGGNQNTNSNADALVKRDTARFKAILLQLKNDSKAPGNVAVKANN
ncbi:hypothetical protein MP228_001607 [Amoeboaphelidium protococcarum]|nr:hypothetical protein MP228_001607 [Amoeboaphelidium protococcarum]